jgi:lipopolysaccharide/colanic/teichoic acid biosynthesis glycosyltransferase
VLPRHHVAEPSNGFYIALAESRLPCDESLKRLNCLRLARISARTEIRGQGAFQMVARTDLPQKPVEEGHLWQSELSGPYIQVSTHHITELPTPRRRGYVLLKSIGEWCCALLMVTLASPVIAVLIILVKLTSRGPAFYAQSRLGKRGQIYRILKLRTMVHCAELGTGPVWAAKNDRRVTPLGKILRDTHMDELPQLWNVLRGEMSLIGPRPERPEIAMRIERELPGFNQRLAVRPGITGFAQMLLPADDPDDAHLRGVRRKLAHDLFYVREMGFQLDVRIACSTAFYFLASLTEAARRLFIGSYAAAVNGAMANDYDENVPQSSANCS